MLKPTRRRRVAAPPGILAAVATTPCRHCAAMPAQVGLRSACETCTLSGHVALM
jgi:hypothetical protein